VIDTGTAAETLTAFKSLHSAMAELDGGHPDVVAWVTSVSPDSAFIPSDFRRLLPRDRVNLVGSVSVGAGSAGAGEGGVEPTVNLVSAAAWDDLRDKLQQAEREKAELEWKAATETNQLKRKLAESERRKHELKKQLKRVVPNSSMYIY